MTHLSELLDPARFHSRRDQGRSPRLRSLPLVAAGVAVYPDMDRATQAMTRYLRYLADRRGRGVVF